MPVSLSSRYSGLPVYEAIDADGQVHPTIAIRPPTPPVPSATLYRHTLVAGETLEYLAWRYYGSSEAWWRVAEGNPLVFPLSLPGGTPVAIPSVTDVGQVERLRRF